MKDAQEQTGLPEEPEIITKFRSVTGEGGWLRPQVAIAYIDALRSAAEGLQEQVDNLTGNALMLVADAARELQRAESAEAALAAMKEKYEPA